MKIKSGDYAAIEKVADMIHNKMLKRNLQFVVITKLSITLLHVIRSNYTSESAFRVSYPKYSSKAVYDELVDTLSYNKYGIWLYQYAPGICIAGRCDVVNDIVKRDSKQPIPELLRSDEEMELPDPSKL